MKKEKNKSKSKYGGVILDIITIALLFAAFGMVFYAGFITEEEDLTLNVMSAVTAVGLILLFVIGTFSCLVNKVRSKSLTAGFLAFSAIQFYALLSNLAVLGCLLIGLYKVEYSNMRYAYLTTTGIVLIGYVVNIVAASDNSDAVAAVEEGIADDEEIDDEADLDGDEEADDEDDDDFSEDEAEDEE